uniref:Secreted Insect pheromone binding family protein n=1 Tax=Pristhesancus plagipennis TaxID=1955184 RepID=A0A2K8JWG9_PRIPG|nr:secreted Insect pheromone binding family protein [Pristhesancus plagipennis]
MSKTVIFLCLFVIACAYAASTYTTKYDNIDLDEILNNERIYKKYFDCLANKGKCTPDGKELKDILPDALKTGCSKCNEKQKKGSEKVIKFLLDKKKADYEALEKIYDPTGTYRQKYSDEAKKRGIKL